MNPLFIPDPQIVWDDFIILLNNGMLLLSIINSFTRISTAILLSAIVSIPVGLLLSNYRFIDKLITPFTTVIRFIPVTVFYPLLIMWVGIDESMKISFLFIATFFYFLPTVILITKETDKNLIDTALTMGMNKFEVMLNVVLPASLPMILESFIMMYAIGWNYVIIVESINASSGLGYIINLSTARGKTDQVFLCVIVIVIVNYFFDKYGKALIKDLFKWKYANKID